jgi:radical SAM superfamily enzyme YgiQ (UPF0313 family)
LGLGREMKGRPGTPFHREEGVTVKDWGGRLPVAIIYPNSYHVGMSNLGIHALYALFNSYRKVVAERVFLDSVGRHGPTAIESGRPLTDFAVLAFSISYELDYFNAAKILKTGGIPLRAADRDDTYPLVIAGGPCVTANPMPLSPLFDFLCIGESEVILPQLVPALTEGIGGPHQDLIKTLAGLPGIYVPSVPPAKPVVRQWAANLDEFATTSVIMTGDTELGDMYLIEAERGCPRGCRFCLVSTAFAPMRWRSADNILRQAWHGLSKRRRIGLVGPAVTDHPQFIEILAGLNKYNAEISVSSLRIGSLNGAILESLAKGKARTVTLAPEAGSQRLRDLVNKGTGEDQILSAAEGIARYGFQNLKLYFIVGLPTETDDDVEEIVRLALAIKERLDRGSGNARLTLNVTPFVPKAGTPFQWLPMASEETLNRRLGILKSYLPLKGIKLNEESPAWSRVQGVLSRGDGRVGGAIADMEEVSLAGWSKTVEKNQLDLDYYVNQRWQTGKPLPWSVIDSGTAEERLCGEMEKAVGKSQ